MGCTNSKPKTKRIEPFGQRYVLRVATGTNNEGRYASSAILYRQSCSIGYDTFRHDLEECSGLLAYGMGLDLAIKTLGQKTRVTELHVETHHVELLSTLDDPEYRDETILFLERKFANIRRSYIPKHDNYLAISMCKYVASKKIEPRDPQYIEW